MGRHLDIKFRLSWRITDKTVDWKSGVIGWNSLLRDTDYSGTRAIPAKLRLTFPTTGFCSTFSLDSRVIQSVDPDT
jgi:hypothetical protein